jgi:hypothetical protein
VTSWYKVLSSFNVSFRGNYIAMVKDRTRLQKGTTAEAQTLMVISRYTKIIRILTIVSATLLTIACAETRPLDEGTARGILVSALNDSTDVLSDTNILIDNEETAVEFAESILFKVYGKRHIENEKPYNVANVDGYWVITGTVHAQFGGAFEIVFNSRNGQIVRSTHYK